MRVLVLHAHPNPQSFNAALCGVAVETLRGRGHDVDLCDLYAEGFDPVLSQAERIGYHDLATNRAPVASYVDRLMRAEALALVYPVWNFGYPAILKGYLDRVFLPGVSFRMENGKPRPNLDNIKRLAAVTTYGAARWRAMVMGDPPRRSVMRHLRITIAAGAPARYVALYDMNRAGDSDRQRFLARVKSEMERF